MLRNFETLTTFGFSLPAGPRSRFSSAPTLVAPLRNPTTWLVLNDDARKAEDSFGQTPLEKLSLHGLLNGTRKMPENKVPIIFQNAYSKTYTKFGGVVLGMWAFLFLYVFAFKRNYVIVVISAVVATGILTLTFGARNSRY